MKISLLPVILTHMCQPAHKILAIAVVCVFFAKSSTQVVFAATAATSATPSADLTASSAATPKPVIVNPIGSLNSQITDLRNTYRQNLEVYRNDERLYTTARAQYSQLQTLASLEEVVRATRQVMLSRLDVLLTYLKLVRSNLVNTPGIEVNIKNAQLKQIDDLITDFKTHQTHVQSATDRTKIAVMVTEFQPLEARAESASFMSISLVSYGNMQAVYDKLAVVKDEVKTRVLSEEKDPLQLAEKQRGFDEIDREQSSVGRGLADARQGIAKSRQDTWTYNSNQINQQLNDAYGGVSRVLSLLNEIIR